jgi:hypothetical protein
VHAGTLYRILQLDDRGELHRQGGNLQLKYLVGMLVVRRSRPILRRVRAIQQPQMGDQLVEISVTAHEEQFLRKVSCSGDCAEKGAAIATERSKIRGKNRTGTEGVSQDTPSSNVKPVRVKDGLEILEASLDLREARRFSPRS